MACLEKEVRDKIKVDPREAKAFMNEVLQNMKGTKDEAGNWVKKPMETHEAMQAVADKSGKDIGTVSHILKSDSKIMSITKQAWNRQNRAYAVKQAAKQFAGVNQPGVIGQTWNAFRRVALTGHAPVFPWTHLRNLLFHGSPVERNIFGRAVHDSWAYRGEKGAQLYQSDMAELKAKNYYAPFKSFGLDIGEGFHPGDAMMPGVRQGRFAKWSAKLQETPLAKKLRLDPANASRSFDALKKARYDLMEHYWKSIPEDMRSQEFGEVLAREINYATGSITQPRGAASSAGYRALADVSASKASSSALLASKLFYAKRLQALAPLRLLPRLLLKGGEMTAGERAASTIALKRWGRIATTQFGLLGVNAATAKMLGVQGPNMTDPSKGDYMRMRFGDWVIPLSPMMDAVREPVRIVYAAGKRGDLYEAGKEAAKIPLQAAHPAVKLVGEQVTGKDQFTAQPVPSVHNYFNPPKPSAKHPAESLGEYASQRVTPIAASAALKAYYQELRDNGMNENQATAFMKAMVHGATSGLTATDVYEDTTPKK